MMICFLNKKIRKMETLNWRWCVSIDWMSTILLSIYIDTTILLEGLKKASIHEYCSYRNLHILPCIFIWLLHEYRFSSYSCMSVKLFLVKHNSLMDSNNEDWLIVNHMLSKSNHGFVTCLRGSVCTHLFLHVYSWKIEEQIDFLKIDMSNCVALFLLDYISIF